MHPQAEHLSAYLDNELGAAERAEVERLLTEDAAARELLAELKSVRAEVQALPRVQLSHDLAEQVLRAAERSMLLGPAPTSAVAIEPATRPSPYLGPNPRATARKRWSSPAWFVAGAAVAAVLMLTLGPWFRGAPDTVVEQPGVSGVATGRNEGVASTAPSAVPGPGHSTRVDDSELVEEPSGGQAIAQDATNTQRGDAPPTVAVDPAPSSQPVEEPQAGPVEAVATQRTVPQQDDVPDAPYGLVVLCNISHEAYADATFDTLLRGKGIQVGERVRPDGQDTPASDVVYVEGTPEQLAEVLAEISQQSEVYQSPLMQFSLGKFRDPSLWSETLEGVTESDVDSQAAAQPTQVNEAPVAAPAKSASRGVHFSPGVTPAKPLAIDTATPESLQEYATDLMAHVPPVDAAAPDGNSTPLVDHGLVRAVFVFRILPPADTQPETP